MKLEVTEQELVELVGLLATDDFKKRNLFIRKIQACLQAGAGASQSDTNGQNPNAKADGSSQPVQDASSGQGITGAK